MLLARVYILFNWMIHATAACDPGYWGNPCRKCTLEGCTCFNGDNCLTCLDGYYPNRYPCYRCPNNCLTCSDDILCQTCKQGYTGNTCENAIFCASNSCDQCVLGRYGTSCTLTCSQGCYGGSCNKMDGTCSCVAHYIGPKCEQCVLGRYGPSCAMLCSNGCVDGLCNPTDGGCASCKDKAMFGFKCDVECSKHCLNQSCSINGDCNLGCASNFFGKKCDTPCPDNCADVVTGSRCSQENGVCKNGTTERATSETGTPEKQSMETAGIVGGVAAIVIVGLVLAGVLMYFRTRRNQRLQSSEYETTQVGSNAATDLHLYAGLHKTGNDPSNQSYYNTSVDAIISPEGATSHHYQNSAKKIANSF